MGSVTLPADHLGFEPPHSSMQSGNRDESYGPKVFGCGEKTAVGAAAQLGALRPLHKMVSYRKNGRVAQLDRAPAF
jgi:hypothetical protein